MDQVTPTEPGCTHYETCRSPAVWLVNLADGARLLYDACWQALRRTLEQKGIECQHRPLDRRGPEDLNNWRLRPDPGGQAPSRPETFECHDCHHQVQPADQVRLTTLIGIFELTDAYDTLLCRGCYRRRQAE